MAISPTEIGALTDAERAKVEELERQVDDHLRQLTNIAETQYNFPGVLVNEQVRKELVRRYLEAGWRTARIIEVQGHSRLILG